MSGLLSPLAQGFRDQNRLFGVGGYMRLFCYEILSNDCSIYMKEKDEEGGPGMSSSVFWYFTPDMDKLRAKLGQWTRHVQADDAEKSTYSTEK